MVERLRAEATAEQKRCNELAAEGIPTLPFPALTYRDDSLATPPSEPGAPSAPPQPEMPRPPEARAVETTTEAPKEPVAAVASRTPLGVKQVEPTTEAPKEVVRQPNRKRRPLMPDQEPSGNECSGSYPCLQTSSAPRAHARERARGVPTLDKMVFRASEDALRRAGFESEANLSEGPPETTQAPAGQVDAQ